ncbi:MAG: toll/interleukin-1 receptor domain-containing protein [Methylococcaceae bacterium]
MSNNEPVQDVFISYAHSDDEIQLGAEAGWVTTFVDELKKLLRRKLGGNGASVWMDHQLAANEQVTATLIDSVVRSRTIVLFMSPGYTMSPWCQKELGQFLEINSASKNKENVFIVELDSTERASWHPRLQELTPIRFWREDRDHVPQLLGCPVPNRDPEDPYWLNLNKLAHFIADYLKTYSALEKSHEKYTTINYPGTDAQVNQFIQTTTSHKKIIWIAEPTDDLIDQWEALAEALRQAGADLRPLGLDTYPRSTEAEFLASIRADLNSTQLFVQLLSQVPGRHPKDSPISYTALQSSAAGAISRQQQCTFLQWRNRDINLDQVTDEEHRHLLTGAIACGFEEFRQRVLAAVQSLNQNSSLKSSSDDEDDSLAICISAHKSDYDLGQQVCEILVELGADALTTQTEPAQDQSPTEFNTQLDEVITNSEGMIIVYGQTPPVWVQAQYMRARKALAQKHKGLWSALLDGPPFDKPSAGVMGKNLMTLECRDGLLHNKIERFVNTLRGVNHA